MRLKIISWNIWVYGYFNQIANFFKTSNGDIIGLQEVQKDDPQHDIIGCLSELGYEHTFAPVKKIGAEKILNDGPAIFSKYKILRTETYLLSETDSRATLRADIQVGDETLHVFSTHLIHTHQQQSDVQDRQVTNLIKVLPRERVILMGDFNATPDSTVIKSMQDVLVDSDPSSQPTWSIYPEGCPVCNPLGVNTRLDYIFTSKDIKINSFKVESSKGSDHLPISVMVEL